MKISVVMSTFNRADILPNALRSVLKQTHPTLELIVVDDASTDNTEEVVRSFSDKRIKYIKLPENIYYSHARNVGIKEATGRLLAFHDDDVIWSPNFLEEMVKPHILQDVVVTYCSRYVYTGVKLKDFNIKALDTLKPAQTPKMVDFMGNTDNMNGVVDVNELLIKKSVFKGEFQGFRKEKDNMYYCSDIALLDEIIRHNRHGRFIPIKKRLVHYFLEHGAKTPNMTSVKAEYHKEHGKYHPELEEDWLF